VVTPSLGAEPLWGPPDPIVLSAFEDLVASSSGMSIYAPSELPSGTQLAPGWWPLSQGPVPPGRLEGENPLVVGDEGSREVRVLLRAGSGWLEVMQGIRGDLGDLPGRPAGTVEGREATLYAMLGGQLVHWSHKGTWYGVFARDLAEADLLRIATGMKLLQTGH